MGNTKTNEEENNNQNIFHENPENVIDEITIIYKREKYRG